MGSCFSKSNRSLTTQVPLGVVTKAGAPTEVKDNRRCHVSLTSLNEYGGPSTTVGMDIVTITTAGGNVVKAAVPQKYQRKHVTPVQQAKINAARACLSQVASTTNVEIPSKVVYLDGSKNEYDGNGDKQQIEKNNATLTTTTTTTTTTNDIFPWMQNNQDRYETTVIEETAFSMDAGSMATSHGGQRPAGIGDGGGGCYFAGNSTIASSVTGMTMDSSKRNRQPYEIVMTDTNDDVLQKRPSSKMKKHNTSDSSPRSDKTSSSKHSRTERHRNTKKGPMTAVDLEAMLQEENEEGCRRPSAVIKEDTIDEWKDPTEDDEEDEGIDYDKYEQQQRRRSSSQKMEWNSGDMCGPSTKSKQQSQNMSPNEHPERSLPHQRTGETHVQGHGHLNGGQEQENSEVLINGLSLVTESSGRHTPSDSSQVGRSPHQGPQEECSPILNPATTKGDPAHAETPKTSVTSNRKFKPPLSGGNSPKYPPLTSTGLSPRPFGSVDQLPLRSPAPRSRRVQPSSMSNKQQQQQREQNEEEEQEQQQQQQNLERQQAAPGSTKRFGLLKSPVAAKVLKALHQEEARTTTTPSHSPYSSKLPAAINLDSPVPSPAPLPFTTTSDNEEDAKVKLPSGEGPWMFSDLADPAFRRLCSKLRKKINFDPWDDFKRFEDEELVDFVQMHPETCRVRYQFDNFTGKLFPLSIVCTMEPQEATVRSVLEAYPPALVECDVWIGTPLHYASGYKAKKPVIKFLIQRDPTMLARTNQFGRTPLHMACLFKAPVETVTPLLELYPQAVETADKDGYTPMHLACENGASVHVIQSLLEVCSKSNLTVGTNAKDSTPLHIACANSAPKSVLKALLDHCPEAADHFDEDGQLPLHLAVQNGLNKGSIELLIDAFPRAIEIKNRRGQTAHRIGKRKHMTEAVMQLLEGLSE